MLNFGRGTIREIREAINMQLENGRKKSLHDFTEEEIEDLPDRFLCVTRTPGLSYYYPVFSTVSKEEFIKDPDKCFYIDSYWKYAYSNDIYIATREDVEEYKKNRIASIERECNNYKKTLIY